MPPLTPAATYGTAGAATDGLPTVHLTRYIVPLREGGSLPGLMEADDLGTYAVKYRGAGQGLKALIAEVIAGRLAQLLGLPTPRLVGAVLPAELAPGEPDEEVQALLRASTGLNLGVDYLPGALDVNPRRPDPDRSFTGRVLWFDAVIGNADRSWRNPNLLVWHRQTYLIDHGASLTFHHNWATADNYVARPYDAADHALMGSRPDVAAADDALAGRADVSLVTDAVAAVPQEWLAADTSFASPAEARQRYVDLICERVARRDAWLPGLITQAEPGGAG